jgi:hypothetical protein
VELDAQRGHIERIGYYRFNVNQQSAALTRRGGIATLTPGTGRRCRVNAFEEVLASGTVCLWYRDHAPRSRGWDPWNSAPVDTGGLMSARYVPAEVYGQRISSQRKLANRTGYGCLGPDGAGLGAHSAGHWISIRSSVGPGWTMDPGGPAVTTVAGST